METSSINNPHPDLKNVLPYVWCCKRKASMLQMIMQIISAACRFLFLFPYLY
jgi:meiotically up-regulated gene 157 (Mug157) protein